MGMFTGIVETTGVVRSRTETDDGLRLQIGVDGFEDLHHGQSISVSGVCLTVEAHGAAATDEAATDEAATDEATTDEAATGEATIKKDQWFEVFLASETVEKTYLGDVEPGDGVNLERAMPADGRFDGHVVQGHVDTITTIEAIEQIGEDWRFTVSIPAGHDEYLVEKGSIALDGISLTVATKRDDEIAIAIIPTTYAETTLAEKSVGDPVHVEVDVIAKYVETMLEGRMSG